MIEATLEWGIAMAHARAQRVKGFLLAGILLDATALLCYIAQTSPVMPTLRDVSLAGGVGVAPLDPFLVRLAQVQGLVFLVTAVLWLLWLHRAYRNLTLVGSQATDRTPGWVVGCWFVPILNLVFPYFVMHELWVRSATGNVHAAASVDDPPALMLWWWVTYLLAKVLSQVVLQQAEQATTATASHAVVRLGLYADSLSLLAAILAFRMVAGLDRLQRTRLAGAGTQQPGGLPAPRATMPPAVMPMDHE
jgi:hypothetical protein